MAASHVASGLAEPAAGTESVELRELDSGKGRGLVARRRIRKGDVLFSEQPAVSAQFLWNEHYKYRACHHCLRALETAEENARRLTGNPALSLPHPELCHIDTSVHQVCPGCQVRYCGTACRQEAEARYHRVLCPGPSADDVAHPLTRLREAWRMMHYPPETCSIMLLARMIATVKQADDKESWVALFSRFCSRTVNEQEEVAHKLLGKRFQDQLELLRDLLAEALFEESLAQWFSPEGFRSLFALVGTNGQGIGTSSLSQWVHACDDLELPTAQREHLDFFIEQLYRDIDNVSGDFLNCEGSGLYVRQSCCNHSCVPNAEATFPDNDFTLHLTALSDIESGEEICISYLEGCQRERSRHSRQKILRDNYLFTCACPKCLAQAGDPDETSDEDEDEEDDENDGEMTDI
ncbi:unnamed protein product [Lampetra planeri]